MNGPELSYHTEVAEIVERAKQENAEAGLRVKRVLLGILKEKLPELPILRVYEWGKGDFKGLVTADAKGIFLLLRHPGFGVTGGVSHHHYGYDASSHDHRCVLLLEDGIYEAREVNHNSGLLPEWESRREIEPREYLKYAQTAFQKIEELTIPTADLV